MLMQRSKKYTKLFDSWDFSSVNYMLFGIGVLTILLGYYLMWTGDTISFQAVKLSPVVLVFGYCVIIPISIMYKSENNSDKI
jgi:hypothetical protein